MPEEKDTGISRRVSGEIINDKTIEELQIRIGRLEAERFTLAAEKEILSIDNEKLKKNIVALTEEKQQLSDRLTEIESRLVRPKLTSTELISSFKDAMDLMQEGLKTPGGRVNYIIDKFDVDLKANIGVDQNNRVIIQSPHLAEKVPAENLSVVHFSLKAVPKPEAIEAEGFIFVPNLIGRGKNDAIKVIEDAGLSRGSMDERLSPAPSGTVIEQNPETEAMVPPGTAVDIVISKSRYVIVPNVIGLSKDNAIEIITNRDLNIGKVTGQVKGAVPDIVLSQGIPAGTEVTRGSTVDLVIAEPEKVKVPNLAGKTRDDAIKVIKEAKLTAGKITEQESEKPKGAVIGQNPKAEAVVVIETAVDLVIAKPEKVKVPNLAGKTRDDAIKAIKEAKLTAGKITEKESQKPEGTVIEQDPKQGTSVVVHTPVNLTIAKQIEVTEVITPNVTGMNADKAKEIIAKAGLEIGRITRRISKKPPGSVIIQNPEPGTKIPIKGLVNIVVSMRRK